jgi:hypothetical protein
MGEKILVYRTGTFGLMEEKYTDVVCRAEDLG